MLCLTFNEIYYLSGHDTKRPDKALIHRTTRTIRTVALLMENPEKILAVKKNSLKNRRAHLNENWVVKGWRARPPIAYYYYYYLHYICIFFTHTDAIAHAIFIFFFLFSFFGKSTGAAPPHMRRSWLGPTRIELCDVYKWTNI